ncbi:MAG: class I SAM-dependent methyltransferase [Nanoarchaeota archaeon]
MTKIFSDYAKYYNLVYTTKDYKQEADFVYNWANKPKTILELGCGTGQHAKYWTDKTNVIYAVDNSQEMINQAYKHPKIKYMCIPLQDLDPNTLFDCVFSLFNVMGYTLLEYSLDKIPITKNGIFIFDVWDASKFKKYPSVVKVKHFNLGYRVAIPEQITDRLIKIDYIIVEDRKVQVFERHFVQGYFRKDIEKLCKLHKYKIVGVRPTKDWSCWYKLRKL